MLPPKGITKWKTKYFYVNAAAITAKLQFRNVTGTIITENISVPKVDTVDWFPQLRIIGWFKLDNRQLWVLRMMIGRMSREARPVLREKNGAKAPLWRMFCPDFEDKVHIVKCGAGEEGWNRTIIGNFRMPDEAALNAVLPGGKGYLGALGYPAPTGVPKETVLKFSDRCQRKKTHEVSIPSLVSEVAGILRTRLRKYGDYVVVSDTLEGLGVPGGSAAVGGSNAGTKPIDDKKRQAAASVAGGEKVPKFRKTQATAVPKPQTVVPTGKLIVCYTSVVVAVVTDRCVLLFVEPHVEPVSLFATPPSPPKVVDVEVQKKGEESPSIEVVGGGTAPSVHAEETSKKTAGETIVDTLDSSNNLIDPQEDGGNQGEKPKSPEKTSGSTAASKAVEDQTPIQPGESELEYYYRSYAAERGFDYHLPLGMFCRGMIC
ncbi:hypothetical protein HanLR1_Chr14g0531331 [Helianthus annuus]|nr:hypothetical protein HanHA89_Chr14g0568951 [Helianthus annuus]KAJ0656046.1 hypothetical protein HanLR1_Chr14g0531331 [Helianthus annuus]